MAHRTGAAARTEKTLSKIVVASVWLTSVIVALAVGFGMTSGTLSVPLFPSSITMVAGWIVVIVTLLSVLLALIERLGQ